MTFTNKRILILSPQSWGKMYLSKHHYAIELAKAGNTVYFLNPPMVKGAAFPGSFRIYNSGIDNLFLIDHRLNFPYNLKFHAIVIFHWLMRFHIKKLLKTFKEPFDIIWSFDLGNLYPFRFFDTGLKVFHPVDEPLNQTAIRSATGAQIIFSVTKEILEKYSHFQLPAYFINHGVSENFFREQPVLKTGNAISVGFSGNLTRGDIDRTVLLTIIRRHPSVQFHFWGSYHINQSNISGSDDEPTVAFIRELEKNPNVILHGPVPSARLAVEIHGMDAFLICYDVVKDQSKGTNYHKIMEYLSTGKVIVSNNVTTYQQQPDLITMVKDRDHNKGLPGLFDEVVQNITAYNAPDLQAKRISFAHDNLYSTQIGRIGEILQKHQLITS